MKVEGWYATEALTQLLSTIGTHPLDERSRLLHDQNCQNGDRRQQERPQITPRHTTALSSLCGDWHLTIMPMLNTRAEVIIAIASFRDSEGQIPDGALMAILQVQWEALKPDMLETITSKVRYPKRCVSGRHCLRRPKGDVVKERVPDEPRCPTGHR
jgi:hypothetical protein